MSVAPAISAVSRPETAGIPYITPVEFQNAPTGLDLASLIPGGSPQAQTAALQEQILRASSWMDLECHQVLAATQDVEVARVRVHDDGRMTIFPRCFPVRAVTAISTGWDAQSLTPMTSLANIIVGNRSFTVWDTASYVDFMFGSGVQFSPIRTDRYRLWVQYAYPNGYPVTVLASGCTQGATSLSLISALGVVPGMTLSLTDNPNDETVTVSASYVLGANPVAVSATQYAHAQGVSVSSMPWALKQACIEATAGFIQERGKETLSMASLTGGPVMARSAGSSGNDALARAKQILCDGDFIAQVSVPGQL